MKRHEITKRVGAMILAAGLLAGETSPALAAENKEADTAAQAAVITADEAAANVPEDTQTDEAQISDATEETEILETEKTVAASETQEAPDGGEVVDIENELLADEKGVSTVIGLEGETSYYAMESDDKKTQLKYAYSSREYVRTNSAWRTGVPVAADANGLYSVDGCLYANATYDAQGNETRYSGNVTDCIRIPAAAKPVQNPQTKFYEYNGKAYASMDTVYQKDAQGNAVYGADGKRVALSYYINPNDEVVSTVNVTITAESSYLSWTDIQKAVGKKVSAADTGYGYYDIGGKLYSNVDYSNSASQGNNVYAVTIFGTKGDEISFDRRYQYISWKPVSNQTEVGSNGKVYYVGYQVEVNKTSAILDEKAVNGETFTTETLFEPYPSFAVGEQAVYRVRAVYYTITKDAAGAETYAIVAKGDWSDAYAYKTEADKTALAAVPTVTGLTAALKKNSNTVYDVKWNGVADANGYSYQILFSDKILDTASVSEYTWNQKASSSSTDADTFMSLNMNGRTRSYYAVCDPSDDEADWEYYTRSYYKYVVCADNDPNKYTTVSQYNPATGKDERISVAKVPCEASDIAAVGYERVESNERVYFKNVTVDTPYAYIRVAARVTYDNDKYVGTRGAYSVPCMVQLNNIAMGKEANVPAITGLKVENQVDGSFVLKWNRINDSANVAIFYAKEEAAFADGSYLYELANASVTDAQGNIKYLNRQPEVTELIELAGKKVKKYECSGADAEEGVSSSELNLEYGKKYFFRVVSYDSALRSVARPATPYVLNQVAYTNYTDISAPASVSAVRTMGILAKPATRSESGSITLTFGYNSNITGYEIYRKSGKKYTKIATSTSREYVDDGLKANTTYNYKAIAYNYNPITKATYKSDAVFFSAETCASNYIDVKVVPSGKTAAKVTWTKVPGAVKYEIYRSNTVSVDNNLSKKNSTGNSYAGLANDKWSLVKSVNNAKTTSYTDKKLTAGETYTYQVVATYKAGKVNKQIRDSAAISLKISAPQNVQATLSGKKVKVTWKADKYAKKFEVRYMVYNAEGKPYNDDWTVKSAKKNTYTVPNSLKNGESVTVQVRASDGKKWTAWSAQTEDVMALAAVKGVKAVNTTVKDANQVASSAVKISWSKVSGAAYYQVYRSTSPAVSYNADEKVYTNYSASAIAKESNYDEGSDTVYYDEYKGQRNTVTGTSVIDRGQMQSGVTYYYFVVAFAENGTAQSYGIAKNCSVTFEKVAKIKSAKAAKGKVTITITKTAGASKYVIYRSEKKDKGYQQIGTTKKTSYTDKKVKKGKTYYYKIVATGKNGLKADFSAESAAVKVKAK